MSFGDILAYDYYRIILIICYFVANEARYYYYRDHRRMYEAKSYYMRLRYRVLLLVIILAVLPLSGAHFLDI